MSDNVGYDKQDPNPLAIGGAVVFILMFTFISGLGLQAYFDQQARELYVHTVLQSPNDALTKLNAQADERLHKYGWVDKANGVAHMPIDEAMKLSVTEIKNKSAQPASAPVAPKKK